jgi:hypothetical protein
MSKPCGTADKLLAQAEANGYEMGAHKEKDEVQHYYKYTPRIAKNHDTALDCYMLREGIFMCC